MKRVAHLAYLLALLVQLLALALLPPAATAAESVVVASSFPKELLNAYKQAFDRRYPAYRLEFVNFPGTNIIPFLADRASGSRPDVFWSSSSESFRALLRHGLLQSIGDHQGPAGPSKIGKLSINEPAGFYKGQALSGYGIMWNTRYLAARTISPPKTWSDLVKPEFFGHVVMSSPSRSGTTHLIVESILQGLGWDAGWSLILQIAGNCATITDRSFDVPNSVTSGRFGVGLVVDFLALSGKYSGLPVDFVYAFPSAITPASIGLISGARNPEGGLQFIDFALSREGQSLLFRPEISRLPVLEEIFASADRPVDYPDLFAVIEKYPSAYDPDVSEARYLVVNAIFNQVVTFRHRELVSVTKIIHAAERRLQRQPDAAAAALIGQARQLVYRAPIAEADDLTLATQLRTRAHIAEVAAREAEWARQADENYEAARGLALRALTVMR